MKQGWDSYNAAPTDPELVAKLLTILFALMKDSSKPPQLIPLADGGIQAEWHSTHDLEVIVSSSEPPRYYFFDPATESDEEGSVLENINRVRALIEKQA